MTPSAGTSHVFIIRAWREAREDPDAEPLWRFSVEHIPSGARFHSQELETVRAFIEQHIGSSRAPPGWRRTLTRLLSGE